MLILIALVCILIFAILLQIVLDRIQNPGFYRIKGPIPVPFFGNALLLGSSPLEAFRAQRQLTEKYGNFFKLIVGTEKVVVTSDPEHLEKILSSQKYIKKSAGYDFLQNWLGYGLVNSTGALWKKHRKIITPAFHFKSIQDYAAYMETHLKVLIEIIKGKSNEVINIHQFVKLYALDTICDSAMRLRVRAQLDSDSTYAHALKRYLDIHMTRFFSAILRIPIVFKLSAIGKEQLECVQTMHTFTDNVIDIRKNERRLKSSNSNDTEKMDNIKPSFIDLLLEKQEQEHLTDNEIRDEVSTFVFAGSDTVSSTISFCLYEIAKHPEVQQRLLEESWQVIGKNEKVDVNTSNIQDLTYLDMVVKECMRIYTTVPLIERHLEEDIYLNGHHIKRGTTVQIFIYALHWSKKIYPNPEKFDPERFTLENVKSRHTYSYIPFSAGPRNCIGFKYGILLTKATIINILRNFEVLPAGDPKYDPILLNNAILESHNGINIRLRPRKGA